MAVLKDEEEQKGQGTSQALAGGIQPQETQEAPAQPQMGGSTAPTTIGGGGTSPSVKAMPKQQKAGTGTFANLKSYLQAAQGGGRVSQAATQRVQNVASQAKQGIEKAQQTFGAQMQAGSLKGMDTAAEEAKGIIGTATGTTYQVPQPAIPEDTTPRRGINPPRLPNPYEDTVDMDRFRRGINPPTSNSKLGDYFDRTGNLNEVGLAKLGDKASAFQEELKLINNRQHPMDYGPGSSNSRSQERQKKDREALYEKYGLTQQAQPTVPAQPQQYFTPEQQQRFAEIINAQYQGPQSLQQAGLYEQAARRAQVAQQALQQTQTAAGREQLLRDVYGRNREYTRGQSKLDALLLNASQPAVQSLQQQAQQAGNVQQQLQEAQNLSANEAAQRAAAIQGIASGAREQFTTARTAEEAAVEERLAKTVENWNQLPDYFKEILKEREKGPLSLTQQEADLLGIRAGEGIYNLSPDDLIKTNLAERDRLITKNELSRQLALQQLANLDTSRQLQKDLMYTDLEKAGTQTAADAINKQAIRDVLEAEEKSFADYAKGTTISGEGLKKHRQTGDKYRAKVDANLADVLERMGYAPTSSTVPTDQYSTTIDPEGLQKWSDSANFYSNLGENIGRAMGIGSVVSGRYAKDIANQLAIEDLQRKINETLSSKGFSNRAAIGETETTKARQAALEQILADREKLRG
jgi:hypothetical protein